MLGIGYLSYNYSRVTNLNNFYKENLPETYKIRSLIEGIKLLFGLPQSNIIVDVAEGERVYKITLLNTDVHKIPFGYFVFLPLERRLDAYDYNNPTFPMIQWKGKKIAYNGLSLFLDKAGVSGVFTKLVNVI